ncbi:MAG: hypothetical protein ACO1NX_09690 [Chitinophagaceae bacterium]
MLKYLFYIFLAYMLYQVVFKLIIPIYRTTRQVKKSFRDMQEQMNAHAQAQGRTPVDETTYTPNNNGKEKKTGEYIDFEEIKD